MSLDTYTFLAVLITAVALVLIFGALLILYGRLKESFRRRTDELEHITNRLESEIDERRRSAHDLAESELRFRQLVETLPVGVLICDERGFFTFANTVGAQMFRTTAATVVGKHYSPSSATWSVYDRNGLPLDHENNPFTHVLTTGLPVVNSEYVFEWHTGHRAHYSISAAPVLSAEGAMRGLIASIQDVTDLARTRKELEEQKRFFEQMFLQSPVATQIFDQHGNRLRANTEWCRLFDADESEIADIPYNIFEDHAVVRAGLVPAMKRVVSEGINAEWEILLEAHTEEATMRWFRVKAFPVWGSETAVTNMIVHYEDISERRRSDEELRKSLKEKELLLKEVHHRVKNNMQLMKSMLNLQAGYVSDPTTLSMFNDSASRINTMALIHEKLYQSENFGSVDIRDYLTYIADSLYQTYVRPQAAVSITTDLDPAILDIDTAIPCGLLANELISNAMKHAFKDRTRGSVELSFHEIPSALSPSTGPKRRYRLTVSDDGSGLPENLKLSTSDSLGLKLVNSLVQQLDGEIRVDRGSPSGTVIEVRFCIPKGTDSHSRGVEKMGS